MAGARNLYDILNVSHDAEPVVIEAAYRALMKKYHPDQGVMATADGPSAADINRAYAILRDSEKRSQYDHYEWTRQQQMHLAQYQPPVQPRAPRAFGWGGWVVALLLAGVILLMARDREDLAAVNSPDLATPAHAEVQSEPKKAMPSFLSTNAPEREVEILRRVAEGSAIVADSRARAVETARERWSARRQKARPVRHRPPKAETRHDRDFLEREGYIY